MKKAITFLVLFIQIVVYSQNVGINNANLSPDPSAGLDVNYTDKGVLIPRLTTVERNNIAAPATGLLIYNVDCDVFQYWNGTTWITIANTLMGAIISISGPTSISQLCLPITFTYSIQNPTPGMIYTWTVPAGASITGGQGTPVATISFSNSFTGGAICVSPSDSCLYSTPACIDVSVSSNSNSVSFNYLSNNYQTWVVPNGVYCIQIKAWGAGGGGGGTDVCPGGSGGAGAFSSATVSVSPGDLIQVYVGQGGGSGLSGNNQPGGTGGWGYGQGGNGGNSGTYGGSGSGGGGGGSSAVFNTTINSIYVVAGGGGGAGGGGLSGSCAGGNGGASCQNGGSSSGTGGACGGNINANGTNGGNRIGDGGGGGGGGGGYLAGGTGGGAATCDCGGGGGGGGDSVGNVTNGSGTTPGNSGDPDLCPGCAQGGNAGSSGSNGFVIIYY